jgi:hypothetical protein
MDMETHDENLLKEEEIVVETSPKRKNKLLTPILVIGIIIAGYLVWDYVAPDHNVKVSVPGEWISEFSKYDYPSNRAYTYFATYVKNLTHIPLVNYEIDELQGSFIDRYRRQEYIYYNSNITDEYDAGMAKINIANPHGKFPPNFTDHYRKQLKDMISQGIQSYSRLEHLPIEFNADNDTLSLRFNSSAHFFTDLDVVLNVFYPKQTKFISDEYGKRAYNKTEVSQKKVVLVHNKESDNSAFNPEKIIFTKTKSNPRKDVQDGVSDIGIFHKFGEVTIPKDLTEVELPLGTVFFMWSPNIPTREMLWLYNNYFENAKGSYLGLEAKGKVVNGLLKENNQWVPDEWQGLEAGHTARLNAVKEDRKKLGTPPEAAETYLVYYDRSELRDFAQHLEKFGDDQISFRAQRSVTPEIIMSQAKEGPDKNEPYKILYIYGIDQHSNFSVPIQLMSKSFWYIQDNFAKIPNYLHNRVQSLVRQFNAKTVLIGQVDPAEYEQFAELERELTIGEEEDMGGLFPLFTAPYSLAYRTDKFEVLEFNSSRGFNKIIIN